MQGPNRSGSSAYHRLFRQYSDCAGALFSNRTFLGMKRICSGQEGIPEAVVEGSENQKGAAEWLVFREVIKVPEHDLLGFWVRGLFVSEDDVQNF